MTRDDIIAIAESIGLHYYVNEMAGSYVERLERFAAVVASIEREACAKVCDQKVDAEYATGKVDHNEIGWTQACAIAIRARNT